MARAGHPAHTLLALIREAGSLIGLAILLKIRLWHRFTVAVSQGAAKSWRVILLREGWSSRESQIILAAAPLPNQVQIPLPPKEVTNGRGMYLAVMFSNDIYAFSRSK
jgi:hypothetical protein